MALVHDCETIMATVKARSEILNTNAALFDIYEGNLLPYVVEDMKKQFSEEYLNKSARHRIAPINILRRVVDKLSRIYKDAPMRRVEDGSETDLALVAWYEKILGINQKMQAADEFFSLFKTALLQIAIDPTNKRPILRVVPSSRFLPFSNNSLDPTRPSHIVTMEGNTGDGRRLYHVYSADEFAIVDERGAIQRDLMAAAGMEGVNPYGVLPFVYVNRSQNILTPPCDSDIFQMAKLLPVMFADLNTAAMYQSFSIIYGVDIQEANLTMAPNSMWMLNSQGDGEKKPQIGTIKPEVDISQVLTLIQTQFALWLNSRGIRPGSVGQLTADNFASGISKMVDEMDVSEERQKQVGFFRNAEGELWDLLLKSIHPVWVKNGWIDNRAIFDPTKEVSVTFHEQLPMVSRSDLVKAQSEEVTAGFTTKKRAIKKLNPDMTDVEIDSLIAEINKEKGGKVEQAADAPAIEGEPMVEDEAV